MNLFEYEKIGHEILQKCNIERKMVSLLMQKYSKSKECRGFAYKKHTAAAAYMIWLTFVYILYSLYIVFMYKKHAKALSVSLLCRFCYSLYITCMYKKHTKAVSAS